jgi:hypothetical protein
MNNSKWSFPRVEEFRQFATNGRYARIATRVVFSDGQIVNFTERLPKRVAIEQAIRLKDRAARG